MPSFFSPSVGASVSSTSMYAPGPSRSRSQPRHNCGRRALMNLLKLDDARLTEAAREVARRRRARHHRRPQGVHVGRIAQGAQVLQPVRLRAACCTRCSGMSSDSWYFR